jgi:hypothetical protein
MLQVFALNILKVDRTSAADLHVVVVDQIFRAVFLNSTAVSGGG